MIGCYVPLAGQIQALRALVPEWHADAGDGIEMVESIHRLIRIANIPEAQLPVAHLAEARRRHAVVLAHPHRAAVLRARVARAHVRGLLLPHVPHAQLLVARCRDHERAVGAPRQRLHDVIVLERQARTACLGVPDLDGEVSG